MKVVFYNTSSQSYDDFLNSGFSIRSGGEKIYAEGTCKAIELDSEGHLAWAEMESADQFPFATGSAGNVLRFHAGSNPIRMVVYPELGNISVSRLEAFSNEW